MIVQDAMQIIDSPTRTLVSGISNESDRAVNRKFLRCALTNFLSRCSVEETKL